MEISAGVTMFPFQHPILGVWFSLQAEFRGNKQSAGLVRLEGKPYLWWKRSYVRGILARFATDSDHESMDLEPNVFIG